MKKHGGKLKDWYIHDTSIGQCLTGTIAGPDPTGRFEDGNFFRSSLVVEVLYVTEETEEDIRMVVETENSTYNLVGPREESPAITGDLVWGIFF